MQNMEARCRKAYVCVNLDVDKEGAIRPRFIRWDNGLIFQIDQILYKAFTAQFDQQIKEASDTIMRLTSERNSVMGGLAEQQSWLEQFRKYANIKELTRSTVVNLIDYIHIRENKDIDVGLMHCDRFASIVEFLRERQEKEDANKVIRFERKVV